MTTLEEKTPEEIEKEARKIQSWLTHKPSREQCEKYADAHTSIYKDIRFYIFQFNRGRFGLTTHTLSTSNMHNGNILEIIRQSKIDRAFISLEEVTFKEYAQAGAIDIPCCALHCEYEGGYPPCIRKHTEITGKIDFL